MDKKTKDKIQETIKEYVRECNNYGECDPNEDLEKYVQKKCLRFAQVVLGRLLYEGSKEEEQMKNFESLINFCEESFQNGQTKIKIGQQEILKEILKDINNAGYEVEEKVNMEPFEIFYEISPKRK